MTKRLKYTKDILTHMLSNNTNSKGGPLTATSGSGTGSGTGTGTGGPSSRMGTLTSAVSSKRSVVSGAGGETGMPSSVTGRTSSSN